MIRGLVFRPENPAGDDWMSVYPTYRGFIVNELREIRLTLPNLTHLMIPLVSSRHFTFPIPQSDRLTYFNLFLDDIISYGFKLIPLIATPCVVSNEYADSQGDIHVGGHSQGQIINGYQLYWNVAYCPTNHLELAKSWVTAILQGISTKHTAIEYIELGGNHRLPFATELGPLEDDRFKNKAAEYLVEVRNAVKLAYPSIRVAVSTMAISGYTERVSFIASTVPNLDYYSVACDWTTHIPNIAAMVGNASKLVINDFKMHDGNFTPYENVLRLIGAAEVLKTAGWWIWEYKDRGLGGVRERNIEGGSWNRQMVDLIRSLS